LQAGWLRSDAGADGLAAWFGARETSTLEQEILGTILRGMGFSPLSAASTTADMDAKTMPLVVEFETLVAARAGAGDPRWLDLYVRVCRYRDGTALLKALEDADVRAALDQDLAALLAANVPAEDPSWDQLRARAVRAAELDHQYAALQYDIQQLPVLRKATGARGWNGTSYVPLASSVAEEIASQTFHTAALVHESDRDPADIVLRRTAALLDDLKHLPASGDTLAAFDGPLAKLRQAVADVPVSDAAARRALHHEICQLRRQIAFANPLLDFQDLVFIKRHRAFYQHMCDQFYGICQNPGGGLYVLQDAFGPDPQVRDVLADSVCGTGRLQGQKLSGGSVLRPNLRYDGERAISGEDAEGGSFLSPALSPDGRRIAFAYVERQGGKEQIFHEDPTRGHWDEGRCYHLFSVNVDGTDLQQLTDGTWNDFDPCWLPNGRLAFISERRGGYLRCGRACPLYTLYDMNPDGSGINCLSFHDSNEWSPNVAHDGRIVWTRWDYTDRHGCIAHMPWVTTLDGRDPRPLHGNYAPRQARPDMELYVRAIPGSPKYVGLAAPHHGQAYGSLVIINPQVTDDDGMGPVRRLTPEVNFPESQGGRQVYSTPWPLAENYHLCVYDAAMSGASLKRPGENYGLYLLDAFGNKELLYRDPDIGCMNPIPLRPHPLARIPAPMLAEAAEREAVCIGDEGQATMAVINVYDHQKAWPEDTKIHALRILQVLPCAVPSGGLRPHETGKRIAEAADSVVPCRWVLGTVPVEADGSAHFTVPAYRELFFQALDERGMAITSMRSATHARHGEPIGLVDGRPGRPVLCAGLRRGGSRGRDVHGHGHAAGFRHHAGVSRTREQSGAGHRVAGGRTVHARRDGPHDRWQRQPPGCPGGLLHGLGFAGRHVRSEGPTGRTGSSASHPVRRLDRRARGRFRDPGRPAWSSRGRLDRARPSAARAHFRVHRRIRQPGRYGHPRRSAAGGFRRLGPGGPVRRRRVPAKPAVVDHHRRATGGRAPSRPARIGQAVCQHDGRHPGWSAVGRGRIPGAADRLGLPERHHAAGRHGRSDLGSTVCPDRDAGGPDVARL
jgi:hypothetical protein